MELKDKVAIVTGASSGIGATVAKNLNEAGMKLVLTARSQQKLSELTSQLQNTAIVPREITDPALPKQLLDTAIQKFGQLDVVINNAGVMHMTSIEEADIEALCNMIRISYQEPEQ